MKRLAPETFRAAQVRWQLFVTLTWRGQPPRAEKRQTALRWWLRKCAQKARVPYDKVLWIARDGDPVAREIRPHWHVLICGLPSGTLNLEFGCAMSRFWFNQGATDARMWVEGLGAFDYSTSMGANGFESSQFGGSVTIICSESLKSLVPGFTGDNGEQEDAGHSEYPEVTKQAKAQQQPILTAFAPEGLGYLVAVNASRTEIRKSYQADITGTVKLNRE